jgi:hypothetical protein
MRSLNSGDIVCDEVGQSPWFGDTILQICPYIFTFTPAQVIIQYNFSLIKFFLSMQSYLDSPVVIGSIYATSYTCEDLSIRSTLNLFFSSEFTNGWQAKLSSARVCLLAWEFLIRVISFSTRVYWRGYLAAFCYRLSARTFTPGIEWFIQSNSHHFGCELGTCVTMTMICLIQSAYVEKTKSCDWSARSTSVS